MAHVGSFSEGGLPAHCRPLVWVRWGFLRSPVSPPPPKSLFPCGPWISALLVLSLLCCTLSSWLPPGPQVRQSSLTTRRVLPVQLSPLAGW